MSHIDLSTDLTNLAPIQNTNTVQSTIHTSSSTHTSIDVNGFDIYQMRRTNLIRVYDVDLKIDNVPIENWFYTTLNDYY